MQRNARLYQTRQFFFNQNINLTICFNEPRIINIIFFHLKNIVKIVQMNLCQFNIKNEVIT